MCTFIFFARGNLITVLIIHARKPFDNRRPFFASDMALERLADFLLPLWIVRGCHIKYEEFVSIIRLRIRQQRRLIARNTVVGDGFLQDSVADSNVGISEQPNRSLTGSGTPKTGGSADGMLERVLSYNVCVAEPLTKREDEILQLIIRGLSNKQIARLLCRSERTVEYHRNRLMRKMGVRNAAGLVKRAMTMGLA